MPPSPLGIQPLVAYQSVGVGERLQRTGQLLFSVLFTTGHVPPMSSWHPVLNSALSYIPTMVILQPRRSERLSWTAQHVPQSCVALTTSLPQPDARGGIPARGKKLTLASGIGILTKNAWTLWTKKAATSIPWKVWPALGTIDCHVLHTLPAPCPRQSSLGHGGPSLHLTLDNLIGGGC